MIFITPQKQLSSSPSRKIAEEYTRKNLDSDALAEYWVEQITEGYKSTVSNENNLIISVDHSISVEQSVYKDLIAQATILNLAFPKQHYSLKTSVSLGFSCPSKIESEFKNLKTGMPTHQKLKAVISQFNSDSGDDFKFSKENMACIRFKAEFEKPMLSSKIEGIEDQSERMFETLKKHITFKVRELLSELTNEFKIKIKNEKSSNFSLDR
ncbi:hypothetical protein L1267_10955 [Pseudoalteromonas sp. OFAV1]|jgi:hypothetical protein|uniref:hypothetical protein n=1 Tax=Pseudoalteromonas sp. OFAV1 TaxID=2908892 RepID=UPI001F200A1F|nr:hypothetical protein [Pseudoalteromonas sp. OFAV1]MCF2900922.1 hypothetical protein [Pseudoalteromonas sp. OFAV1]